MDARSPARPSAGRRRLAAYLLVPALGFLALLAFAVAETDGPPAPGDEAPDFEAPTLSGDETLALADLRGRPVVLNFWASWCGPCEEEAPMLGDAHKAYRGKVEFVGVDIRDDVLKAREFVARHQLDYLHVRDPSLEIYEDYGLTGQPETFFIDEDGRVVEHVNGPVVETDLYRLLDALARDLG
jgi:cytochrome c biogenesis protein CcmG, thiol:disulfide interchange protein DsbE